MNDSKFRAGRVPPPASATNVLIRVLGEISNLFTSCLQLVSFRMQTECMLRQTDERALSGDENFTEQMGVDGGEKGVMSVENTSRGDITKMKDGRRGELIRCNPCRVNLCWATYACTWLEKVSKSPANKFPCLYCLLPWLAVD